VLSVAFVAFAQPTAPGDAVFLFVGAATPLLSVVAVSWLACRFVGDPREPMDGAKAERWPLAGTALLVIVASAVGGVFGSDPIGPGLLVPGVACLLAVGVARVPRSAWLAVAVPAFAVLLTWATPTLWQRVGGSGGALFLVTDVAYALLMGLSCWIGTALGGLAADRLGRQPRATT
jgi:hypothetical protein